MFHSLELNWNTFRSVYFARLLSQYSRKQFSMPELCIYAKK
jgi:hypothetical protein